MSEMSLAEARQAYLEAKEAADSIEHIAATRRALYKAQKEAGEAAKPPEQREAEKLLKRVGSRTTRNDAAYCATKRKVMALFLDSRGVKRPFAVSANFSTRELLSNWTNIRYMPESGWNRIVKGVEEL